MNTWALTLKRAAARDTADPHCPAPVSVVTNLAPSLSA